MNFKIVRLTSAGPNRCHADLRNTDTGTLVGAEFIVDERNGIRTATVIPDVFREFDGTAEEQRSLIAAVVAFCAVADET